MIDPEFEEQYFIQHGRSYYEDNTPPADISDMREASNAYIKQDYETAFNCFQRAAEKGNAHALYEMGELCLTGKGVPKDREKAVELYRKAAEQGYERAKKKLVELKEGGTRSAPTEEG